MRIAMIAMTTSSSIRVNPRRGGVFRKIVCPPLSESEASNVEAGVIVAVFYFAPKLFPLWQKTPKLF